MTTNTKFFVERPVERWWVPGFITENKEELYAVIEAKEERDFFGDESLEIIAPEIVRKQAPIAFSKGFVECQGPARILKRIEYVALIHSLFPNKKIPSDIDSQVIVKIDEQQKIEKQKEDDKRAIALSAICEEPSTKSVTADTKEHEEEDYEWSMVQYHLDLEDPLWSIRQYAEEIFADPEKKS